MGKRRGGRGGDYGEKDLALRVEVVVFALQGLFGVRNRNCFIRDFVRSLWNILNIDDGDHKTRRALLP